MLSRSQRASWLLQKLQAASGNVVRIRRGGRTSAGITGVLAFAEYDVIEDGMPTLVKSADWFFQASDLVLAGDVITLRQGDELVTEIDGVERVFQVMPIAQKPAQEAKNGTGSLVTVHSKEITCQPC